MKIEEVDRTSVENNRVTGVILQGGQTFPCKEGTFAVWSPVEPKNRARNPNAANGAFVRFYWTRTGASPRGMWVEAPLGSLVAVTYEGTPDDQ